VVGLRLALASAFVSIIPAELLAADSGLGYLLQQSSMLQQTDRIFVALAMICTIGFCAGPAVSVRRQSLVPSLSGGCLSLGQG
jgi:ABC-type nitrate/sulfonate/bicarbonate transport system permease component